MIHTGSLVQIDSASTVHAMEQGAIGEQAALDEAQALVEALGDPYTYLVSADKYGQDLGRMGSPKPPPPPSACCRAAAEDVVADAGAAAVRGAASISVQAAASIGAADGPLADDRAARGERRGFVCVAFLAGNTATEMRQALVELRSAGHLTSY